MSQCPITSCAIDWFARVPGGELSIRYRQTGGADISDKTEDDYRNDAR